MKKLLTVIALASFVACSDTKTESTSTDTTTDTTSKMSGGAADAKGGNMSIQDSTRLLDRQLSDTTGVGTDTLR